MKFIHRLAVAIDFILKKRLRFLLISGIICVNMILMILVTFLLCNKIRYRFIAEHIINDSLDSVAIIEFNPETEEGYDNYNAFADEICKLPSVKYLGDFDNESGNTLFPELLEMQNGRFDDYNYATHFIEMSPDVLQLYGIKLKKGKIISNEEAAEKDEYWSGYYLGSNYSDTAVGNVYTSEDGKWTAEVLGIIDDGEMVFSQYFSEDNDIFYNNYYRKLDDYYICVNSYVNGIEFRRIISLNDGYDVKDLRDAIIPLSKKYKVPFSVISLEERVNNQIADNEAVFNSIRNMAVMLLIVAVSIIISFQTISLVDNYTDYGIMLSCGCDISDIKSVMIIEFLLKYLIAYFFAVILTFIILLFEYFRN